MGPENEKRQNKDNEQDGIEVEIDQIEGESTVFETDGVDLVDISQDGKVDVKKRKTVLTKLGTFRISPASEESNLSNLLDSEGGGSSKRKKRK